MNEKITVITVCYNSEKTIEKTIESILAQTYENIEYIIIDGASNDRTADIINNYKIAIEKKMEFKLLIEKDNGIYDAMNKGLNLSSGEWIIFMNSDDVFYNEFVLEGVFNRNIDEKISLVYGDVCYRYDNIDIIGKNNRVNSSFFVNDTLCHQVIFIRRLEYLKYNGFSKKYKIVADKDIILKIYFEHPNSLLYIPIIIAKYKMDGFSVQQRELSLKENEELIRQFYSKNFILIHKILYWLKTYLYKIGSRIKKLLSKVI